MSTPTIDEVIVSTLSEIVPVVKPNIYIGNALEYIVFNYTEYGDVIADSEPDVIRYSTQIHWYLPHEQNPRTKKKQIRAALLGAGFTTPAVINASDSDGQHYTFECEYVDGDV